MHILYDMHCKIKCIVIQREVRTPGLSSWQCSERALIIDRGPVSAHDSVLSARLKSIEARSQLNAALVRAIPSFTVKYSIPQIIIYSVALVLMLFLGLLNFTFSVLQFYWPHGYLSQYQPGLSFHLLNS